jgi:hypothetical protein
MPNETTQEATGFTIVDNSATLKTWTDASGRTRTTTGQIAVLSTGQRLARSMVIDGDVVLWAYGAPGENDRTHIDQPGWRPASFFEQQLTDVGSKRGWHNLGLSQQDREFAEFARLHPAVADFIKLPKTAASTGLFDTGLVRFEKGIGKSEDELRALLTRHRQGDWERHGTFSPNLSDDDWFTCGLLPVDKQNSAAVLSRAGAIRSRFRVNDTYVIDVFTILAGTNTRTLMYLEAA